jgi:hypothetical protein
MGCLIETRVRITISLHFEFPIHVSFLTTKCNLSAIARDETVHWERFKFPLLYKRKSHKGRMRSVIANENLPLPVLRSASERLFILFTSWRKRDDGL